MSEFALAEAVGVRVIRVVDLGPDANYLPSLRILLVDANLDADRRERVMDLVLAKAFELV